MKILKFLLVVLTLAFCSAIQAQNYYKVNADRLNVRTGPGSSYNVQGSIESGQQIVCYGETQPGWMKISYNGGYGYVSSKYLTYLRPVQAEQPQTQSKPHFIRSFLDYMTTYDYDKKDGEDCLYLILIILVLTGLSYYLMQTKIDVINDWWHVLIFFILICVQIYYFFSVRDPTWFCSPDEVGWIATIICFFIYATVLGVQAGCFYGILMCCQYNGYLSPRWVNIGIGIWIALFLSCIIPYLCDDYYNFGWLGIAAAGIYAIVSLIRFAINGEFLWGILFFIMYLAGGFMMATTIAYYIVLMIVALLICAGLWLVGGSSSSNSSNERTVIRRGDGTETEVTRYSEGVYKDSDNNYWKHTHGNNYEQM